MKHFLRYIVIFTLTFGVTSCGSNENTIPDGVIVEDKMVDVIVEIELTQALIKLKFSNQDTINQQQLFNDVYDDFEISEEQFNRSLAYYCKKPKVLMEMYAQVITNLSEKQAANQ